MESPIVLSHVQAAPLLAARRAGFTSVKISPDLGLTTVAAQIMPNHVIFPDGEKLTWADVEKITEAKTACFTLQDGEIEKIQRFSEDTNRFCSLMPTEGAPTLLLAGFPMHRIKDTDPYRDTRSKIKSIAPITGRVLDTTTGLGYTAIAASKTAEEVITVEFDPSVLEVARLNPWSRELFDNPRIEQLVGDSFEVVEEFRDGYFSRIIHDPPTFSLAGELYSEVFYRQLFRVLRRGGRLFHYIGDLDSSSGHRMMKGAAKRLGRAGFINVRPHRQAFGLVAYR
jgi:predicted methyltransferase